MFLSFGFFYSTDEIRPRLREEIRPLYVISREGHPSALRGGNDPARLGPKGSPSHSLMTILLRPDAASRTAARKQAA